VLAACHGGAWADKLLSSALVHWSVHTPQRPCSPPSAASLPPATTRPSRRSSEGNGALDVQWAPSSRSNDVLARACTRSDQAGFNLAQRSLGVPPGGGARPPWFSLRPTHPAGLGLVAASEPSHRALHAALLAIAGHDRSAEEAVEAVVGAGGHEPVRLDAIPAPATPAPPPC
jgi:hypothetical protein